MCVAIQSIGLLTVNAEYEEVLQKKTRSDKPMFATAWKLEELKKLCVECHSLHAEIKYKRHHANTSATATPTPKPGEVFGGVKEAITAP